MLDDDVTAGAIMSALRLSRATFFEWKRLYRPDGVDDMTVRPSGSEVEVDRRADRPAAGLAGRDPRQFQLDFALWTRVLVGELIRVKPGCG
jgi:hypothetical protein